MNKPFLPSDLRSGNATIADDFTQAALAVALNLDADAGGYAKRTFNNPKATKIVERMGTLPTGGDGTASAFASTTLADIAAFVTKSSTLRYLISAAIPITFVNSVTKVRLPAIAVAKNFHFVPPGAPIPVFQGSFVGPELIPYGVKIVAGLTRELADSPNGTPALRQVIGESIEVGAVGQMLDGLASDGTRPDGLRYNHAALTAAAAGATAMETDLFALGGAVAVVAGDLSNIVFICDPITALKISISLPLFKPVVLASSALPLGEIICFAINALAIGAGDGIKFSTSKETAMHYEDEAPQQIALGGVVAAPVRSLFQTDTIAIRMVLDMSWGMRVQTGAISWTSVNW